MSTAVKEWLKVRNRWTTVTTGQDHPPKNIPLILGTVGIPLPNATGHSPSILGGGGGGTWSHWSRDTRQDLG